MMSHTSSGYILLSPVICTRTKQSMATVSRGAITARCISQTFLLLLFVVLFSMYLALHSVGVIISAMAQLPREAIILSQLDDGANKSNINTLDIYQLDYHPASLRRALSTHASNGYLIGNKSNLDFYPYAHQVDLRIIVIVFDRASSLQTCLASLNDAIYDGSRVSLHVWIDRDNTSHHYNRETYRVARTFNFTHGAYQVHIQASHVGIQGQWTNTWRPAPGTQEVAVIIEDDLTMSRYFWRWLRGASRAYRYRPDISGMGLAGPGIAHKDGSRLDIPVTDHLYLYRVICTWGFAPNPTSWRAFQNWFYHVEQNTSFQPLVPGILPSQWFLGEKKNERERSLWEMWHIYYTHNTLPPQFTVLANTRDEGNFAINRHENGVHDNGRGIITDTLCRHWKPIYDIFPLLPSKYGYDGKPYDES